MEAGVPNNHDVANIYQLFPPKGHSKELFLLSSWYFHKVYKNMMGENKRWMEKQGNKGLLLGIKKLPTGFDKPWSFLRMSACFVFRFQLA